MLTWLTNAWDAMSLQLHPLQLHPLQLHRLQRHHLQLTRNFGARSTNLVKVLFFSIGASKVTTSSQQQRTWPSIERRSYAVLLVCPCGSGWSGLSGTSVCLCVKLDRVMAEAHDVVWATKIKHSYHATVTKTSTPTELIWYERSGSGYPCQNDDSNKMLTIHDYFCGLIERSHIVQTM